MIKFLPLLLALGYGLALYAFSSWRTRQELTRRSRPLDDPQLMPHLDRLAQALDLPKVQVFIYEISPINGLAAPDGRIFLTRGFYETYQRGEISADELISVVAHELGHVALGHSRRRLIDFGGQNALHMSLIALIVRAIPVIGPLIAAAVAGLITRSLAAHLSRRDEYEADAWATALMIKSGMGAEPQMSLLRKLDQLTQQNHQKPPAWLLTHPPIPQRIAAIEVNQKRWA